MSVTAGSPLVSVPVLSTTTTWTRAAASIAAAFLNKIPRFAPRPVPTMIAVGVARPRASGHVMTTTVIAKRMAWPKLRPASNQTNEGQGATDQRHQHQPEGGPIGKPLTGR